MGAQAVEQWSDPVTFLPSELACSAQGQLGCAEKGSDLAASELIQINASSSIEPYPSQTVPCRKRPSHAIHTLPDFDK